MEKNWIIGQGKSDITCLVKNTVMFGYSDSDNIMTDIETPLSARAFYFENNDQKFLYINLETCHPSESIIIELMELFKGHSGLSQLSRRDLMVTAQHTHAAMGGFFYYPFYNIPTPGHLPEVLKKIVKGSFEAAVHAYETRNSTKVLWKKGDFDLNQDISFNRSMRAYIRNEEIINLDQVPGEREAVNNEMNILDFQSEGESIGILSWFAVHATSLSPTNNFISPDNKGYASLMMEETLKDRDAVAIFAQGESGDVSPNYVMTKRKLRCRRGRFKDEFESARYNGKLQFDKALDILQSSGVELRGEIDSELIYVNFPEVQIDKKFVPANERHLDVSVTTATMGSSFLMGTEEGMGLAQPFLIFLRLVHRLSKIVQWLYFLFFRPKRLKELKLYNLAQGNKAVMVDGGLKKFIRFKKFIVHLLPDFIDPVWQRIRRTYLSGSMKETPWFQETLPVQITILDKIALVAIPGEPTTMTGKRIKETALNILSKRGVEKVLVSSYANSFAGYITTPEEYQCQCYEGGHTLFGRWTLPAYQTIVEKIAKEMLKPFEQRDLDRDKRPPIPSKEEIAKRTYQS